MATALLLGLLTTAANLLGSALSAAKAQPSRAMMASALAFSGGFLLAAAFLELAPEAMDASSLGPLMIGVGFLLVYFTEHLGNVHMHELPAPGQPMGHDEHAHAHPEPVGGGAPSREQQEYRRAVAAFAAFNVHDLMDGLAIGAAMVTDTAVGVLVFFAVLLHEVPAGFAIGAVIRGHGGTRMQALLAGLTIGVVTLVGIAIPFLVEDLSESLTGVFLGLAAGTFVYLGASILLPTAETGRYRWSFVYVGLGFGAFWGTSELVGSVVGV